jgi:adenylate cyclase
MERRLAAILVADVVGYSARVGDDEEGTINSVRGHMDALELVIGMHHGRVVKTMGDGILVEFGSVVDAVSCAATMQIRMVERNRERPIAEQIQFRIGVHVGDILIAGDDIFGDGVNIAARVESIAKPGGVVVTSRVHEDVLGKLDVNFNDIGEHSLKNIDRPIGLFEIGTSEPDAIVVQTKQSLPDKPSLAVLPFQNMSPAQENEYFADGLTEDITTALAYVPWIFVIARNSSFTYKGAAIDVRTVGQELGVRYVLEGSVRQQGQRLRVTGQLIDAETGAHIWAEKYDGTMEDVFELQDQMTEAVVAAIAPTIQTAEIDRAIRNQTNNLDAYDHYLQALAALNRAQTGSAATHLDQAIAAAPDYAKAMAIRAWCYSARLAWTTGASEEEERRAGLDLALKSLEMNNTDLEVAAYAGYTLGFFGADIDRSFALVGEATEKCPSFAWAWTSRAMLEALQGEPERALEYGHIAQRLSPKDPQMFRVHVAIASGYQAMGNHEQALREANLGLLLNPNIVVLADIKMHSSVKLGRVDEVRKYAQLFQSRNPAFRVSKYIEHKRRFRNYQAWSAEEQGVLLKLGLPQ